MMDGIQENKRKKPQQIRIKITLINPPKTNPFGICVRMFTHVYIIIDILSMVFCTAVNCCKCYSIFQHK